MPGLPFELYIQCRTVWLSCQEFTSYKNLRSVFVPNELFPFLPGLPQADNSSDLVDQCLVYLVEKRLPGGLPVLPFFVKVLCKRYPEGDALRDDLDLLYRVNEKMRGRVVLAEVFR
jgi:hypothetical protein